MTSSPANVVSPSKLAHVALRTARFEESISWWTTVLGARTVYKSRPIAFLTYDDEHHRLAIIDVGGAPQPPAGRPGLEHLAFTYESLEDLVSTYERLRDAGIRPHWCVNHGMTMSMYYRDPDQLQVELQIDLCSPADGEAFMRGPRFAANPIGINYDPEQMVHEFHAGNTPSCIAEYGPL